jgi:hypothetical protein
MSDRDTELEADAARNGQLKTPVEARQGVKTRHMRWVLAISLTLGVVALGGAYAWYATATPSGGSSGATASQHLSNG